ncbi:hypothetical protein ANCDUO_01669 [Ancylostoma duodenale]|uniref:Uncharacterized protein n=1 Tax=Ancylostoma duodenale TaxID=51022 RepID=A0A0C2H2H7_9BILA|nr:hypothetical protein ANCDUO_01669 [Ancylostoma duodenale]
MEDLYEKLRMDDDEFDNWLRSMGLLKGVELCRVCGNPMKLGKENNESIWICHARSCRTGPSTSSKPKAETRKQSFFYRAGISNKQVFQLSVYWARKFGLVNDKAY